MRLGGLERHVCIGDLWDWSKIKDHSEREHEARNRQVNPLDILERLLIVANVVENSVRSDDRCHDRSDSVIRSNQQDPFKLQHQQHPKNSPIKSLRKIDPNLRILRRPTNRDIWVRGGLQTPQPIPNNENRRTKPSKRLVQNARPSHKRSDAI
jgi:hypothetical protein